MSSLNSLPSPHGVQGDGGNEEALVGVAPNDRSVLDYAASDRFRRLLAISHDWAGRGIAVRYEDMVRNPLATVHGVIARLGAEGSGVEAAVAHNTFARLHQIDPMHHPRGIPGGWRRFLTATTAEAIASRLGDRYLGAYRSDIADDASLDESEATDRWRNELHEIGTEFNAGQPESNHVVGVQRPSTE